MDTCHCGRPIHFYDDLENFTRNMCLDCSEIRCDLGEVTCPMIVWHPYEKVLDRDERTGN